MKILTNKATKFKRAAVCLAVAALTSLFAVFASSCGVDGTVYAIPESKLPTEEKFALKQYAYDDLDDVQTTVRADVMNVTQRGLKRAETQTLSNDFSLVYDTEENELHPEYGANNGDGRYKTATISFIESAYPDPMHGKGTSADAYAAAAADKGVSKEQYFTYYKYMFMTQSHHLSKEASRRSALTASDGDEVNSEFAAWLKKHPAADKQYGEVLGTDNAVQKEITVDPLYRSQHATGLYLPAGEAVTVKVEGLKQGESLSVILGSQDTLAWRGSIPSDAAQDISNLTNGKNYSQVNYANAAADAFFKQADLVTVSGKFFDYNTDSTPFLQSQWARQNARAPYLAATFTFTENKTYTIGFAYGGLIQIGMNNCYSSAKLTFTGAVETPHYILGVTTPDYFDEYLRDAPGVIAVLDTENGQLIGPTGVMGTTAYMRQAKKEEIDKLAMLWHSFLSVNESFTGGVYNRYNKVMFDWHVPAGAAVALGGYTYACPTGWYNGAMNYRGLLASGQWGILHEVGHNHGSSYGNVWGFGGGQEGEVRNNALTLLAYIKLCDVGTTIRNGGGAEHGGYANPYSTLSETLAQKGKYQDFGDCGYFQALGMYANIMHSFGADKYYELLYSYKSNPSYVEEGTSGNKRSDFAYRCSLVYGMNFIKYFNDFYAAKITDDMFTAEQLAEMQLLPDYMPVSSFYAGGIDGVKTAGDYIVAYGDDITFDLVNNTKSALDNGDVKGFEVISVGRPEHGKIREQDGKWIYSFDKNYTGVFDGFSFTVRLSDGVIHTLTVTLRISYNGARVSSYTVENPNASGAAMIENLEGQIANLTPVYINSAFAGVPAFTSEEWQVRVGDFWWRAPVSGEVSLAVSGNNGLCLYFGEDFSSLEKTNLIYTGGASYNHAAKVSVEEGKYYAVRVLNTNRGGRGGATVGIANESGKFSAIPAQQVFHPDYPLGKEAETYIFEPQYLVSKKDNIKISVTGTDKSEWTMLKAPENVLGGRYETQQLVDPDTGIALPGEEGILKIDKWTWLIDGQSGTTLHTTYGGGVPRITEANPHEFVVDTSKTQTFNYFAVTTRNNVNSYITDCELQISDSPDGGWQTVATADRESYKGTTITMKFPEVSGRYLRLLVKGTTGGNFSVLAELDAGIQSTTQQVVPSSSKKFFATKGWINSATEESEPNGYMISQSKNEKLVIKFRGESVALYAATGEGYGAVAVYVDGKREAAVDLNSSMAESRKLIFNKENLENKEHTVEIVTTSSDKVMLNIVGIPYTADLINAANIYKENALTIALVVFLLLFAAVTAFVLCLVFIPKFRNKVFGNRFINKLDNREKKPKKEKAVKSETSAETKIEPEKSEKPAAAKTGNAAKTKTAKTAKPAEKSSKPQKTETTKKSKK